MKKFKQYIRTNRGLVEVIIVLFGALLILLSTKLSEQPFLSSTSFAIGTSVLASAIVVFVTDAFLGAEDLEKVRQWGFETMYGTRAEMNSSCDIYLRKAKHVSVIAFGLRSLRDSQSRTIEKLLDRGGDVRIITMRPGCDNLVKRELDENQMCGSMSDSISKLIEWAKRLNSRGYKGRIEIRYHDHQPLDFMFLMDNRLFTGPYEYGRNSQQTISFEYSASGAAYEHYKNYFQELWDDSEFCEDALK